MLSTWKYEVRMMTFHTPGKTVLCIITILLLFFTHGTSSYASSDRPDEPQTEWYSISGWVTDETPDISEESLSLFDETCRIEDLDVWQTAIRLVVNEKFSPKQPSGNAMVTLRGSPDLGIRTVMLDAEGGFEFDNVPVGDYTIEATATPHCVTIGTARKAVGHARVHLTNHIANLRIPISAYPVALRGRVLTEDGSPMANVVVKGLPWGYEPRDHIDPNLVKRKYEYETVTMSDTEGYYELSGFMPEYIFDYARLLGSDRWFSFVEVTAYLDGYEQTNTPNPPLVTAELLPAARQIMKSILAWPAWTPDEWAAYRERTDLPKSAGNVIFVEDIILEKIEESESIEE